MTSVTIGNSVKTIGEQAFSGCNMTSVIIPNSVQSISGWAFYGCDLKKSAYPNTISNPFGYGTVVAYNPEGAIIEDGFIYGPEKKEILFAPYTIKGDFIIPDYVSSIGEKAFYGCSDLTQVTIPNSVTEIGVEAFANCSGLTQMIIPNSVKSIGSGAFKGCSNLKKSAYPNTFSNLISYGHCIAYDPNGAMIEDGCIFGPDKTSILFAPISLEGEYIILNSVESIGSYAFYGCSGLTQVTIPNSVKSIGDYAFRFCSGLTDITVEASTPPSTPSIYISPFYELYDTATLTIPEGSFDAYASSLTWGSFKSIKFANSSEICEYKTFNDGVLTYRLNTIDKTAIVTGTNTSVITIPERFTDDSAPDNPVRYYVTAIGYGAFKGKTIESFAFNSRSKLEYIGERAFAESTLPAISLPETVKTIGASAFQSCSKLTSMTIPNSVTSIGGSAFRDCSGLTSVIIPNSVTSIGASAFKDCTRLTSMTIPNAVTAIGRSAFEGCKGLTKAEFASIEALCTIKFDDVHANPLSCSHHLYISGEEVAKVVIPESVNSVGDYAFYGCSTLTQVNIPNSVTTIGELAFSDCSGLTQISIPNSVTSIGKEAFYNCTGLNKAEFASIEALCAIKFDDVYANPLYYAHALYIGGEKVTKVVIPESVTSVGDYAFYGCSTLTDVIIGNSVTSIGMQAFYDSPRLKSVTISNSVKNIGSFAFYCGYSDLTSITMVDGTEPINIASDAFSAKPTYLYWGRPWEGLNIDCSQVTDLTIGNCLKEIPAGKFKNNSKLNKLTLGGSLTSIGDNAFSGCTGLTEVILPPAVESIGASAFAGDSKLASIIMGSNVRTIGEKAFDGCPASTVSITAKTPPTAPNNTFSNYSGRLYCVDQAAADAYYDAYTCWDRFDSYVMVTPARLEGEQTEIKGVAGEQIQLTATLWPENVTLPQIFWRSTNPEVATVDENGLVTLHVDINRSRGISDGCKIIAESLYGSQLEFNVLDPQSGILEVTIDGGNAAGAVDYSAPYEIYNLNGAYLGSDLDAVTPGLYIIRQGNAAEKRIVR